MAGRPRTRAKREATAGEPIPDAEGVPADPTRARAPAHDARTHARVRVAPAPRAGSGKAWEHPGPALRAAMDERNAAQIDTFASLLGAGVQLRIERLRPTWCAGWLEDTELDEGALGELLAYVRDEWGGQKYRVSILHPQTGHTMHSVALPPISGPPREQGKIITREVYEARMEGRDVAPGPRATPAPASTTAPAIDPLALMDRFFDLHEKSSKATVEAVREVARVGQERQTELLTTFDRNYQRQGEQKSLRAQLGELRESVSAVEELRDELTPELDDAPEDSSTSPLVDEAKRQFVKRIFDEDGVSSSARPVNGNPAPTPKPSSNIPDAGAASTKHGPS